MNESKTNAAAGDSGRAEQPSTAAAARETLQFGNARFAHIADQPDGASSPRTITLSVSELGIDDDSFAVQEPFALVLGCADARVPIELIFSQGANELFVLRVAGNVLGEAVIGSVDYALARLASIRLLVVLGHSSCGALATAVNAFLDPAHYLGLASAHQLRSIVDQLFPPVRLAHAAMLHVHGTEIAANDGFVAALVESSTVLNAALMSSTLSSHLRQLGQASIGAVYSMYALENRHVGVPGLEGTSSEDHRLFDPPIDPAGFTQLARDLATSPRVLEKLATANR